MGCPEMRFPSLLPLFPPQLQGPWGVFQALGRAGTTPWALCLGQHAWGRAGGICSLSGYFAEPFLGVGVTFPMEAAAEAQDSFGE